MRSSHTSAHLQKKSTCFLHLLPLGFIHNQLGTINLPYMTYFETRFTKKGLQSRSATASPRYNIVAATQNLFPHPFSLIIFLIFYRA